VEDLSRLLLFFSFLSLFFSFSFLSLFSFFVSPPSFFSSPPIETPPHLTLPFFFPTIPTPQFPVSSPLAVYVLPGLDPIPLEPLVVSFPLEPETADDELRRLPELKL